MREPIEFPLLRSPRSFDWNDQNEREHIAKHGVRFGFAIGIFLDPLRIETIDMRHDYGELRYNGDRSDRRHLSHVTFTMRGEPGGLFQPARQTETSETRMTSVRKKLEEIRANPPKLTPEERARLEAMTEEEIERNAESDPDNPPLTDEQLDRMVFARDVRLPEEKPVYRRQNSPRGFASTRRGCATGNRAGFSRTRWPAPISA
jgi:uncharacterized DUF497 family protein